MNVSISKVALGWAVLSTGLAVGLVWEEMSTWAELQRLRQEKKVLTDRFVRVIAQPRSAPPPTSLPSSPKDSDSTPPKPDPKLVHSLAEKDELISRFQEDLASARSKVTQLENALLTLRGQAAFQEQQAREQVASQRSSHEQRLADTEHSLESAQNSLKEERAKRGELESANTSLRAQVAAGANSPRSPELMTQLSEINRRRESYMREITSRYRDIFSQYRSLTGALAGRQDQQIAPWNAAELSRIQSAISSEEDDLRRLDELNGQAALLEKRLAKP